MKEFVEKLIERLEKLYLANKEKRKAGVLQFGRKLGYADGISSAIDIISQLAEEYKSNLSGNSTGWIPVEKRLPEVYEYSNSSDVVLVAGYNKDTGYCWQAMGYYVRTDSIERWFFAECKNTDKPIDFIDIVAWQPLPEDYKPEEPKKIPTEHYEERFNRVM